MGPLLDGFEEARLRNVDIFAGAELGTSHFTLGVRSDSWKGDWECGSGRVVGSLKKSSLRVRESGWEESSFWREDLPRCGSAPSNYGQRQRGSAKRSDWDMLAHAVWCGSFE